MGSDRLRWVSRFGFLGLAGMSVLAPGCAEFDSDRPQPPRASIGQEMYGVICDRLAAQALREDLTGDSFRAVCHQPFGGAFADTVDTSKLPPIAAGLKDDSGKVVLLEKQQADRAKAIGRIEALARRRAELIRAFDATFPAEEKVAIKDIDNPDPTKSCDAPAKSGEGLLVDQIAEMMSRITELYHDGTFPQSTQSLARVIEEFKNHNAAQEAWQRISARQGYRPIETQLGAIRPIIAYPGLRDFSNASLRLLSADSQPYAENPPRDADGRRIPVPGPGNKALNKLLEVAHEEFLTAKADPKVPELTVKADPTGRVVLSRPRDTFEMLQEVLYKRDDAFSSGNAHFIVRRDPRGYAKLRNGALPSPFLDADNDGLPDVDEVGRFKTSNASIVPSPFSFPGAPAAARDSFDRATTNGGLLYEYIDTSRTFAAQMLKDVKPLVNSDPAAQHETVMDMAGALPIVLGPREPRKKVYATKTVAFDGIRTAQSPVLDLVYAMGTILGDKSADNVLAMAKELFSTKSQETARLTGAMIAAFEVAKKHDEAVIPRTSVFWDDILETAAKIAQHPGLLEDILRSLSTPESEQLGTVFSKFAQYTDEVSYDPNDVNGPAYNVTTKNHAEMSTPVDRSAGYTGKNRSGLFRFLGLINDTADVTACNKPNARVHAKLGPLEVTMPIDLNPFGTPTYQECEVFKIDNLAAFYLDVMAEAWKFEPDTKKNKRGTMYLRNDQLREGIALGIGAATTDLLEDSSNLIGFVNTGNNKLLAPKPSWLNRLVFFDTKNDTLNSRTKTFISDLSGDFMGSRVCPERIIKDPLPKAVDAAKDGMVRGLRDCPDGQWLQQRQKNTIFMWEQFGFYTAMKPLVSAFAKHGREDLFLEMAKTIYKHYPAKHASDSECAVGPNESCSRDGVSSYEGIVAETFAMDVFPALNAIAKALDTMAIKTCTSTDASGVCTPIGTKTVSGIDIAAQAARAALDPDYAKSIGLTDRHGVATTKRNDGTPIAQVTPAYLVVNALNAIDTSFDAYEAQNPDGKDLRANWRRARSQLVDQFLATTGTMKASEFANPTIPKMTPALIDLVRSQLWAHCPKSFVAPYEKCEWARTELPKKAEDVLGGPLVTTGIDVMDIIRRDPEARRETQKLMEYLLDAASKNDALANILASANDVVQVLRDDENLIPFFKVIAAAVDSSKYDDKGRLIEKSLVDSQMALLARLSGKAFDNDGKEICAKEFDPNQALTVLLGKLVTPIKDGDFQGQTPLEVIIDVIADVNRDDPTQPYDGTLEKKDYASVSTNIVDFLLDPKSGIEQFYEVVRQGTKL
ncbi:MAG TPA: hypothetical protein VM580_29815 [Labilithrix sp.]|nr:hypothetical protein [Labilithrix sp.]